MPKVWIVFAVSLVFPLLGCSEDGPGCWREMRIPAFTEQISTIWGTSSSDVFAIGPGTVSDVVLHLDGDEWREVDLNEEGYAYPGVWGIPGRYFFLKTDWRSDLMIMEYDGHNWSQVDTGISGWPVDIWGSSPDDIFAVGYKELPDHFQSQIIHYDGATWTEMENSFTIALVAVWGSSSTDVFAVGSNTVLHYDGHSWSILEDNLPYSVKSVWGSSAENVYVAGDSGILRYNGSTWTEVTDRGAGDLWVGPDSEIFMLGGDPVWYSDGSSWINLCGISHDYGKNIREYYYGIWGASRDDVFVIGSKHHPESFGEGFILRSNFKNDLNCLCE